MGERYVHVTKVRSRSAPDGRPDAAPRPQLPPPLAARRVDRLKAARDDHSPDRQRTRNQPPRSPTGIRPTPRTDLDAEPDRSRRGSEPISTRNRTDLGAEVDRSRRHVAVASTTGYCVGAGWPGPGACGYTPPHPGTDPAGTSSVRRTGHHRRASRKNRRLPGGLAGSDRPRSACAPLDPGGRGPHSPARAVVLAVPGAAARQARWYRGAAPHAVGHEPGRAGPASSS